MVLNDHVTVHQFSPLAANNFIDGTGSSVPTAVPHTSSNTSDCPQLYISTCLACLTTVNCPSHENAPYNFNNALYNFVPRRPLIVAGPWMTPLVALTRNRVETIP